MWQQKLTLIIYCRHYSGRWLVVEHCAEQLRLHFHLYVLRYEQLCGLFFKKIFSRSNLLYLWSLPHPSPESNNFFALAWKKIFKLCICCFIHSLLHALLVEHNDPIKQFIFCLFLKNPLTVWSTTSAAATSFCKYCTQTNLKSDAFEKFKAQPNINFKNHRTRITV